MYDVAMLSPTQTLLADVFFNTRVSVTSAVELGGSVTWNSQTSFVATALELGLRQCMT